MRTRVSWVRGRVREKMRMFHMNVFPGLRSCAGARPVAQQDVKSVNSMQLQMCRRPLQLWPYRRTHKHRCSTDCTMVRGSRSHSRNASLGHRTTVLLVEVGRRLCRVVDKRPLEMGGKMVQWRSAMYPETIRGLHCRDSDPERRRLGRGFRGRRGRRWDNPIQKAIGMHEGWQEIAQDRVARIPCEEGFLRRAT